MRQVLKQWSPFVLVSGLVLALDQAVKWRVVSELAFGESWEPIPAISALIRITRSLNTGAAFGMFSSASDLFLILAVVTVVVFIISYPRLPSTAWLSRMSIGLIAGGALSNALDRIRFDHVIDYVEVRLGPGFSNISNLADHAITLGVLLLLLDQWRIERQEQAARREQEAIDEAEAMAFALAGAAPFDEEWLATAVEPVVDPPIESMPAPENSPG